MVDEKGLDPAAADRIGYFVKYQGMWIGAQKQQFLRHESSKDKFKPRA